MHNLVCQAYITTLYVDVKRSGGMLAHVSIHSPVSNVLSMQELCQS